MVSPPFASTTVISETKRALLQKLSIGTPLEYKDNDSGVRERVNLAKLCCPQRSKKPYFKTQNIAISGI